MIQYCSGGWRVMVGRYYLVRIDGKLLVTLPNTKTNIRYLCEGGPLQPVLGSCHG